MRWLETPPAELPRDDARKVVDSQHTVLAEVALAVRRERCEWDMAIRERGKNVFGVLLPEVQQFRNLARLLALKARLQIAEGQHAEAIETIRIGLGMSRHVSQQPFLISGLVAAAIANQMIQQLEELVASDNAPNLYWSITALPDPLIDWREHLEVESSVIFLMYPELDGIENKQMTAHAWRQLWRGVVSDLRAAGMEEPDDLPADVVERLSVVGFADLLVELRYPRARKAMIARGYDEKEVDAMARAQVTLLDEIHTSQSTYDDMVKWSHVPYWQSRDGFAQVQEDIAKRHGEGGIKALHHRLSALRTIEAIRLHAAANGGDLPKTLAAIDVPLPINPFTGKPADYKLDGKTATLTLSSPRDGHTLIYKLSIAQ